MLEYAGIKEGEKVLEPSAGCGAHVKHAYECLKHGGRIVAIMGEGVFYRQDKKASEFREWLEDKGWSERLPEGLFKESGTDATARNVVSDKAFISSNMMAVL